MTLPLWLSLGSALAVVPATAAETVRPASDALSPTALAATTDTPAAATEAPPGADTIVVEAPAARTDPLAQINQTSFQAVQFADRAVVAPVAFAYQRTLPAPLRDGVHNVIYNLREPVTIANCLLQHRIGKAGRSLVRLALNSTLGLGGLFDVARRHPFSIPFRFNGFGNTMGFYGVGPGPYMYLPVFGPTTVRDLAGTVADNMFLPAIVGKPMTSTAWRVPATALGVLDDRLVKDSRIREVRSASNPYMATRDAYLAARREDIAALHRHGDDPSAPDRAR